MAAAGGHATASRVPAQLCLFSPRVWERSSALGGAVASPVEDTIGGLHGGLNAQRPNCRSGGPAGLGFTFLVGILVK